MLLEMLATWLASTSDIDSTGVCSRRLAQISRRCVKRVREDRVSCSLKGTFDIKLNPAFSLRRWSCLTSLYGRAVGTSDSCCFSCSISHRLPVGTFRVSWRLKSVSNSSAQFQLILRSPSTNPDVMGSVLATAMYSPKAYANKGWLYIFVGDVSVHEPGATVQTTFLKHSGIRTSVWKQSAVAMDCVYFQSVS